MFSETESESSNLKSKNSEDDDKVPDLDLFSIKKNEERKRFTHKFSTKIAFDNKQNPLKSAKTSKFRNLQPRKTSLQTKDKETPSLQDQSLKSVSF